MLVIALVLKFISPSGTDDRDLLKFIQLNRKCHKMFEGQILKQALLFETNTSRLNKKRIAIWVKLLNIDSDNKDYYAFRDKVNS